LKSVKNQNSVPAEMKGGVWSLGICSFCPENEIFEDARL